MVSINNIAVRDTQILKGIGICGMLMWHVFWCPNSQGIIYSPFVRYIGAIGDVCVSIFLFISGYGLTVGYQRKGETNPVSFIVSRLLKFYSNFWFVFILIVLFGTFVMNQPIYTEGTFIHRLLQYGKEFFAIRGQSSYNDSWWYFSLILSLYVIYPFLYWGIKKVPLFVVLFVLLCGTFTLRFIGQNLQLYIPIFVVGMLWAMYGIKLPKLSLPKLLMIQVFTIIFPLISFVFIFNCNSVCKIGIPLYAILTMGLAVLVVSLQNKLSIIKRVFCYLGTYATNIYIIHLMFSKYWFSDTFYSISSPWLLFFTLLLSSLASSIV